MTSTSTSDAACELGRGCGSEYDRAWRRRKQQAAAAQAHVEQAQANAIKATKDVERYTPLVEKDVISRQQYDAAVATCNGSECGCGWRRRRT